MGSGSQDLIYKVGILRRITIERGVDDFYISQAVGVMINQGDSVLVEPPVYA